MLFSALNGGKGAEPFESMLKEYYIFGSEAMSFSYYKIARPIFVPPGGKRISKYEYFSSICDNTEKIMKMSKWPEDAIPLRFIFSRCIKMRLC